MKNNIILTGPPRSGTTLTCFLLNKVSNVIALHEPMNLKMFPDRSTALEKTAAFFDQMRHSALTEGKVISKVKAGQIPDNPFGNEVGVKRQSLVNRAEIPVGKPLSHDFKLMIKHNGHFTFLLKELAPLYPCFATIRNPLSSIASWNSITAPVSRGNLTVLKGINSEIYHILEAIPNLIDRQVQLAHYLFEAYDVLPREQIIRYEDIIASGGKALSVITPEAATLQEPLKSKNKNKIYDKELLKQTAERLLRSDGAFWKYYSKEEVEQILIEIGA